MLGIRDSHLLSYTYERFRPDLLGKVTKKLEL